MPQTATKLPDLIGQRVLVTRPIHQQAQQMRLLSELHAQPISLPLLEICPTDSSHPDFQLIKQQIMNLDLYQIVICISPNAARIAADLIDQYWPQLPINIQWYAIGQKSANILRENGIPAIHSNAGFDSEAMLTMPELEHLEHSKVLILRGHGGRTTLAETLSERGAKVEYANLYTRKCPSYSDEHIKSTIYNSGLSSILITSGEALDNFVKVARGSQTEFSINSLLSLYLVVPSERIAEQARKIGFLNILVAQGPDDSSMIAALKPTTDSEANA